MRRWPRLITPLRLSIAAFVASVALAASVVGPFLWTIHRIDVAAARSEREDRALAAQWDGVCPDWDHYWRNMLDYPYPGPTEPVRAAAFLGDAEAALCMADYWRGASDGMAETYYWLRRARRLGVDTSADIAALEAQLPPDIVARQRALADAY